MKLELFSSKRGNSEPNLLAVQAADIDMLPTVLVCPLLPDLPVSGVRMAVEIGGRRYTALCELVRPINRRGLVKTGELNDRDSRRVMEAFRRLLAE